MAYTAAQEFQYVGNILKEYYAPAIVNQVYRKAPLWAMIKKSSQGVYGKQVTIPVALLHSQAVGAKVANTYTLPTASKTTYDQAIVTLKRNYGRIQVDGFAIASAKGKGGWTDVLAAESEFIANSFASDIDRQTIGRGDCRLGLVASVATSAVTVDDPFGIAGLGSDFNLFKAGMVLDGFDISASYAKDLDSSTISSISGNVLTMDTDWSSCNANGDYITREDVASAACWNTPAPANFGEMMGIDGIVDSTGAPGSTTFEDITASSYTSWQSYKDTTSEAISESVLQDGLDGIEKKTDGEAPNFGFTTYALKNKLVNIMQSDRMVQTMDLKAGWKAIRYIGGNVDLPIMAHKWCPTNYFYFLSLPHLKFYTLKKLTWDNYGGGIVKPVADADAYESWFSKKSLGCEQSQPENFSNSGKADNANPEPSPLWEGVETIREAPYWGEEIVQTTNTIWN